MKEALRELEAAQKVRHGDDGYRIPSPQRTTGSAFATASARSRATRTGFTPRALGLLAAAAPHTLFDTKTFKAGLAHPGARNHGRRHGVPASTSPRTAQHFDALASELRRRSQQERKHVFWAVALNDAIDRETVELFRSKEMLARKERETKGEDTPRSSTRNAFGSAATTTNCSASCARRASRAASTSVATTAAPATRRSTSARPPAEILGQVLPEVFDRFKEAAAKANDVKKGSDALFTAENLQGLPAVFGKLGLLRDEKGKAVFRVETGPLKEILDRIEERANYGDTASGRYLTDEFAKEPFGWDFEVVRLLVLSLLRAGKVEATSKGQTLDSVAGVEARDTLSNNNLFRQASFRPKKGIEFEELVKASEAFRDTFGSEVRELNEGAIVAELRKEVARNEDAVSSALSTLTAHHLPGGTMLQGAVGQMKAILRGSEDNAIATFNASHRAIKDAIKRAVELEQALSEPRLRDLERARQAQTALWSFLREEPDISEELRAKAATLDDLLARETFFKEVPSIEQRAKAIESEYERRFQEALDARVAAYSKAFHELVSRFGLGRDRRGPAMSAR